MSYLEMFLKGGYMMWPILLCSIIGIGIIIDRLIAVRKAKLNVPAFMVKIRGYLKRGDVQGAIGYCLEDKSSASNIIRKGLKKYRLGHERVKEAIENAGKLEIGKLEKGLSMLATISGVAPLIGFLGTVTGMIQAFVQIEDLQGSASPSDLAAGIWEALITTAFGLAVGIIAYTFYNYLVSKISKVVIDMEVISNDVVDIIEEATGAGRDVQEPEEIEM
ncbi:MAG: MotA/TolQ/ExbB proton channel family protein [Ignavibacteria bacterium]|nr:MotA/TolQ/ExbB proton channel family protein [Ignavibacteria bacterium]